MHLLVCEDVRVEDLGLLIHSQDVHVGQRDLLEASRNLLPIFAGFDSLLEPDLPLQVGGDQVSKPVDGDTVEPLPVQAHPGASLAQAVEQGTPDGNADHHSVADVDRLEPLLLHLLPRGRKRLLVKDQVLMVHSPHFATVVHCNVRQSAGNLDPRSTEMRLVKNLHRLVYSVHLAGSREDLAHLALH